MVEIIWEELGAVRRFTGDVSAIELDTSARDIQEDSRFPDLQYVIHDFTSCDSISVDYSTRDRVVVRAAVATMSHLNFVSAFVGNLPELAEMVAYFKSVKVYDGAFDLFATMTEARGFITRKNGAI